MSTQEKNGASGKRSPRQRRTRFVKEYLLDQNAKRAAIAAGYSAKTAESQGSRLLRNVKVRQAIDSANEKLNAAMDVTVERVRKELARIAFADPRKFFNDDGSLVPISELDDDTAMALAGIDVNELFEGTGEDRAAVGYCKKVKLASKLDALEQLGRNLQMFTDRIELSGKVSLVDAISRARVRATQK